MSLTFDPKDPSEIIPLTFEFAALASEISTPVVSITQAYGVTDASDLTAMLVGSAQVVGTQVRQKVQLGINGAAYKFRCQADTPEGLRYVIASVLPVEQ